MFSSFVLCALSALCVCVRVVLVLVIFEVNAYVFFFLLLFPTLHPTSSLHACIGKSLSG